MKGGAEAGCALCPAVWCGRRESCAHDRTPRSSSSTSSSSPSAVVPFFLFFARGRARHTSTSQKECCAASAQRALAPLASWHGWAESSRRRAQGKTKTQKAGCRTNGKGIDRGREERSERARGAHSRRGFSNTSDNGSKTVVWPAGMPRSPTASRLQQPQLERGKKVWRGAEGEERRASHHVPRTHAQGPTHLQSASARAHENRRPAPSPYTECRMMRCASHTTGDSRARSYKHTHTHTERESRGSDTTTGSTPEAQQRARAEKKCTKTKTCETAREQVSRRRGRRRWRRRGRREDRKKGKGEKTQEQKRGVFI